MIHFIDTYFYPAWLWTARIGLVALCFFVLVMLRELWRADDWYCRAAALIFTPFALICMAMIITVAFFP